MVIKHLKLNLKQNVLVQIFFTALTYTIILLTDFVYRLYYMYLNYDNSGIQEDLT